MNRKRCCAGFLTYVIVGFDAPGLSGLLPVRCDFGLLRRELAQALVQLRSNMGHIRIGTLPATRRWKDVVGLITDGVEAARVAEAVTHAWEQAFNSVQKDAGFREAVYLLMQIGAAGKSRDPTEHLSSVGVEVAGATSVVEVAMALSAAMERRLEGTRQRSDFGELAQRALVGTVTEYLQRSMPTLLESTADDVDGAFKECGRDKAFGKLSREFFARMTNECLNYFLSKTLPAQVGEGRRFATTGQLAGFEEAMRTHCSEAAEIVESYSSGWFSKELHESGKITRDSAERFGWFGLKKIRSELATRAREDAN
ncbi:MAG TPA: hypothetical protein VEC99_03875 [Clostridia bacterium]|nr:hypothetical protein [Clostridia bacterium]